MSTNTKESISLVVFDMAGTTVEDSGLVQQSFLAADSHAGLSKTDADREEMLRYVSDTMGQSKIVVFRHLARGNEEQAQAANKEFERCYSQLVAEGNCSAIPGAEDAITSLRSRGIKTALTTGFARETQTAIIDALGWHDLADLVLCPEPGMRGRPYPDMPLTALMRTETDSVRSMVVLGDTSSDVISGLRAGARASIGVLTGAHDKGQLADAGATHIIDSVADLPSLLATLR
ncbi:phosphonatase-like hydrolase [Mycolicibacterium wolinskyi]|uniref:Haloacid dehalogenase n=1 Tax=Mycolicibacterium wolinskyi TaxID=59750 RepID=A0A1X2FH13_9MYCO|nr:MULTISPECIES: phosphonatase-like hydrolase [Mycolicibacterium]MCV7285330.1 phosphonatase-like hydrolase [Mycolicibacterium wolinskyi]MCV7295167.1 phosphonatase-like hydrolase [Mycolicibacterium goodii]ORX17733.1 haloacid dehalogenase [Mycolicibacterium wolinskyi]